MTPDDSTAIALEMPSELAGPLPRKVELDFDGNDARYLLVVLLCFFVPGLIVLGYTAHDDVKQFHRRAVLRVSAREVVGEVTRRSSSRSETYIDYRFTVGGATYVSEVPTPASGPPLNKGDHILIRFLPSDPAINHPDAWEWSAYSGWFPTILWIYFTSMGGLALMHLWRERRLVRVGKAVAGTIISCKPKNRFFRSEYEFRTEDGLLVNGNGDSQNKYEAGATVWILYLPRNPKRNEIYPQSLYTAVDRSVETG